MWVADATDRALIKIDAASGAVRRTLELQLSRPPSPSAEVDLGRRVRREHRRRGRQHVRADGGDLSVGKGPRRSRSLGCRLGRERARLHGLEDRRGAAQSSRPFRSAALRRRSTSGAAPSGSRTSARPPVANRSAHEQRRRHCAGRREPTSISAADGRLWVGTRPPASRRGGTLRLVYSHRISIDPALQLDLFPLQSDGLTRDGLVTYNHDAGPAGTQLVPDLAVGIPAATEGGPSTPSGCGRTSATPTAGPSTLATSDVRSSACFASAPAGATSSPRWSGRGSAPSGRDLRPLAGDRHRRALEDGHVPPDAARSEPAREPHRRRTGHARTRWYAVPRHALRADPRNGAVQDRDRNAARDPLRAQSVLPRVVARRAARWEPGRDRDAVWSSAEQEVRAIQRGEADWMADNVTASLLPQLRTRFPAQLPH